MHHWVMILIFDNNSIAMHASAINCMNSDARWQCQKVNKQGAITAVSRQGRNGYFQPKGLTIVTPSPWFFQLHANHLAILFVLFIILLT